MLKELRAKYPRAELRFWVDTGFAKQAKQILAEFDPSMPVHTITSGKLRRYHHLNTIQHLLWGSLMWKNFVDLLKVAAGVFQSLVKLIVWRPDVIFAKGGFVCLPVGIAAFFLRIPLVLHDSDAHPGLTNRILSRWAAAIGTGAPLEYYDYPQYKATYVGIPVGESFKKPSKPVQKAAKIAWNVPDDKPLIVVTGGGLGAKRLNQMIIELLPKLQRLGSVILVSGEGNYQAIKSVAPVNSPLFQLHSFVKTMPQLLAAADVVVSRAGATTILELASLQKPTILVPNAALTGGHQLKNANVYGDAQAAIVIDEDAAVENPEILYKAISFYIKQPKIAAAMAQRMGKFAKPNAAADMAKLIVSKAKK